MGFPGMFWVVFRYWFGYLRVREQKYVPYVFRKWNRLCSKEQRVPVGAEQQPPLSSNYCCDGLSHGCSPIVQRPSFREKLTFPMHLRQGSRYNVRRSRRENVRGVAQRLACQAVSSHTPPFSNDALCAPHFQSVQY